MKYHKNLTLNSHDFYENNASRTSFIRNEESVNFSHYLLL
jgi:hypothetical protein